MKSVGAELIIQERVRQIEEEGWTESHDDTQEPGDLATAGACYALGVAARMTSSGSIQRRLLEASKALWPWGGSWWKPAKTDPTRQLVKAGALIAAEIDRIERERKKT